MKGGMATATGTVMAMLMLSSVCSGYKGYKVMEMGLYLHDKITTPNATGVRVAGPNGDTTTTQFGSLFVIDNIITAGPSNTSTQLGRAKGTFMVASVDDSRAFLAFSAVLQTASYNGTLAFQGSDKEVGPQSISELAIVGGSGDFRLAQGWANYTTVVLDIPDSTVLLNCTVYLPSI